MAITLAANIIDLEDIRTQVGLDCTHPAGHCFGSDGGSGISRNLRVAPGRGGTKEVWELDQTRTQLLSKAFYHQCQYCLTYFYADETEDSPKRV